MKSVWSLLIVAFWAGVIVFALCQVTTFYPGTDAGWFALAAVLCSGGFGVRSKSYRVAALFIVAAAITCSIAGYRRGEEYRVWLGQQPSKEEQIRQLESRLWDLEKTNATLE